MKETGAIENQDTFAVIGAFVAENLGGRFLNREAAASFFLIFSI